MVKNKLKTLATHLTVACILLTGLWLLFSDSHVLIVGNLLILVYIVSMLAFCIVPTDSKTNKKT